MSCMQISAYGPHVKVRALSPSSRLTNSKSCISPGCLVTPRRQRLVTNVLSYHRCNTVCLFGGERKTNNGDEGSPWKSLEKAIKGFRKEKSVQELLREQMEKREFSDGGGIGNPPGGGGGGGSGGDDLSDEGPEEDLLDDIVQLVLAIAGLLVAYFYILDQEEVIMTIKDIFRCIITRRPTLRVERVTDYCSKVYKRLTRRPKRVRKDWLELEIINTPTWWQNPEQLKREFERERDSEN